ncbi:MAG: hypothetical protein OEV64_04040 [Desulfobulbaceae bacterium]|nr:hypothetical protein [Desulfobulbaceae bacterium]
MLPIIIPDQGNDDQQGPNQAQDEGISPDPFKNGENIPSAFSFHEIKKHSDKYKNTKTESSKNYITGGVKAVFRMEIKINTEQYSKNDKGNTGGGNNLYLHDLDRSIKKHPTLHRPDHMT